MEKWNLTLHDENFMYKRLPPTNDNWTLYVQVLTKNNAYRVSNWTTPVVLTVPGVSFSVAAASSTSRVLINPSATSTGSASISPSVSPPVISDPNAADGPNNDWLIPVSGVVAIVLILVLAIGIASVLLLVACVQTKRLGKRTHSSKSALTASAAWSELDSKAMENGALIGIGTFGPVHKVSVPVGGKGKKGKETKEVAVISLKSSATKRDTDDFYDYLELLKMMSNFKDSSSLPVLQLVGFNTTETPHYIMTELSTHGDLLTYLIDIRQNMEGGSIHDDIPASTTTGCYLIELIDSTLLMY
ncbi:PREDICTED: uncharacterized protein LOC109589497, partial [Amphimedon queenslandica]|uniref:Serine-threonine/tyrosine-protein kinase catalytic domain-containing protein n=2 Tax=Amphimedon queenslandica TaxID=400682 RepID=A0AAN0JVD9_AMPQE